MKSCESCTKAKTSCLLKEKIPKISFKRPRNDDNEERASPSKKAKQADESTAEEDDKKDWRWPGHKIQMGAREFRRELRKERDQAAEFHQAVLDEMALLHQTVITEFSNLSSAITQLQEKK